MDSMFCVGVVRVSVVKVCTRMHYEFEATKIVRLGWYGYHITTIVYGHHPDVEKAQEDLCINQCGYYEPIGTAKDNNLILVRRLE